MVDLKVIGLLALSAVIVHGTVIQQLDFISPKALATYKKTHTSKDPNLIQLKQNADQILGNAPYTIVNSKVVPPSGDKHDFYSWAAYLWPDCPTPKPKDYMHECPYKSVDGEFAPDLGDLPDTSYFGSLTYESTLTALAYYMFGDDKYAEQSARLLRTWFISNSTRMNPNLNYAQVIRGPHPWVGRSEGILDMRGLVYIAATEPLLLGSKYWTGEDHQELMKWFAELGKWYDTSDQGKEESQSKNNHETFFIVQRATFLYCLNQPDAAKATIQSFLNGHYQQQILASGEQPLEAKRADPFHYRCFNLQALIYIAQLGDQLGMDIWHAKTAAGATIKTAMDYTIKKGAGGKKPDELSRLIWSVKNAYGDSQGKYAMAYKKFNGPENAIYYIWNQPNNASISRIHCTDCTH